jgi:hypothetical protein
MVSHEIKAEVSGYIVDERFINVETKISDPLHDRMKSFHHRLIDSQDQLIREGLIKLGWTPPPE